MSNDNNAKLIERIRKLYAMAQDSSSPNEAAIAARRARSLMDANGVTLDDLKTSDFKSGKTSWSKKTLPGWYQALTVTVAELNDCVLRRVGNTLTFQGFDVDVIGANLMLDYLTESMTRQRKAWGKETGNRSSSHIRSFQVGFSNDMCSRIRAMIKDRREALELNSEPGTALVCVKMKMVQSEFGMTRTKRGRNSFQSGDAYQAGRAASQRTSLNAQVGHGQRKSLA